MTGSWTVWLAMPAGSAEGAKSSEHEELMQHPEVRAQVAEMFGRHWEGLAQGMP